MKFPVLPTIKTFSDVQKAFQTLRNYFTTTSGVGNVTVTQPDNGSTLTIVDGKTLTVSHTWELRKAVGGQTGLTIDTTRFVEVFIDGQRYKLAVITGS
jgi:hypothetical protein